MADETPDPRTTYLTRVATGLRLSDSLDREVVEELAGHLDDSIHALESEGLDPAMARREALARLGDPDELASGLRHAHQTRRRLLAAAGYGVVAALNGAFWAYLFAAVMTIFCVLCGAAIMNAITRAAGLAATDWRATMSFFAIPTLWFVAAVAGRRTTTAVAQRAFRDRSQVAPAIAVSGAVLVALVTVFWYRGTLDPALVVALLGMPALFAVGALLPAGRGASSGRVKATGRPFLIVLAVGTAIFVTIALLTGRADVHEYEQDFSALGPPWAGTVGVESMSVDGDVVASSVGAPAFLTVGPTSAFAALRDLRFEAWPLTGEFGQVTPGTTGPVTTGPLVEVAPGTYQGTVQLEPLHQTVWYEIATTGVEADGLRYVLSTDGPVTSLPWVGSVWEWLTGR